MLNGVSFFTGIEHVDKEHVESTGTWTKAGANTRGYVVGRDASSVEVTHRHNGDKNWKKVNDDYIAWLIRKIRWDIDIKNEIETDEESKLLKAKGVGVGVQVNVPFSSSGIVNASLDKQEQDL